MALIYFYDATDIDRLQLSQALASTDHHWEYQADTISIDNLDPATEVISVFVSSKVTAEIIEKLPNLKLIACRSTGFNNIDMQAAANKGVSVVNVPTYGEQTVAEYTFTLLLALARKLPQALESFDNEVSAEALTGWDLSGKTIGVIGTGHIGRSAIQIARGFGMNVIAYDPYPNNEASEKLEFSYLPLEDVLAQSDVITLHAPYTTENHHLINADRLSLMKPEAVLINTARGELVDTKALIEKLSTKKLAGAALDVIEGEQLLRLDEEVALLRSDSAHLDAMQYSVELLALHKMPNVIITPHNAFNTTGAISRINSTTAENIIRFWYDDTPNLVKLAPKPIGTLTIARHAESEWNMIGRWTGRKNINLSDKGFHDASLLGQTLAKLDINIDQAFCSGQVRTLETLGIMLNAAGLFNVPITRTDAINERDYGQYTAKNKWDMEKMVGEEEFAGIRRGWDHPVPGGETLKDVYARVVPYYQSDILPLLKAGKNVCVVAHGNSLRALMKYIENISDTDIENLEMLFGNIVVYHLDEDGHMTNKNVYEIDASHTKA